MQLELIHTRNENQKEEQFDAVKALLKMFTVGEITNKTDEKPVGEAEITAKLLQAGQERRQIRDERLQKYVLRPDLSCSPDM